jgi:hypothetical protein
VRNIRAQELEANLASKSKTLSQGKKEKRKEKKLSMRKQNSIKSKDSKKPGESVIFAV